MVRVRIIRASARVEKPAAASHEEQSREGTRGNESTGLRVHAIRWYMNELVMECVVDMGSRGRIAGSPVALLVVEFPSRR